MSWQSGSDIGVQILVVARDGIRLEVVRVPLQVVDEEDYRLVKNEATEPSLRQLIQAASPPPPRVDGTPWYGPFEQGRELPAWLQGPKAADSSLFDGLPKLSRPSPDSIVLDEELTLAPHRGQVEFTRPDAVDPMGIPATGYPQPTGPVDADAYGRFTLRWNRPLSTGAWVALSFDRFDPNALSTAFLVKVTGDWLFASSESPYPEYLKDEEELEDHEPERHLGVGNLQGAGNDRVGREDQLNFTNYVHAFSELIRSSDTKPPLTIGIFGSWGMGKSFLLEHIERNIRNMQGDPPDDDDGKTTKRQWRQARRRRRKDLKRRRRDARAAKAAKRPPDLVPYCYVHIVSFNAWEYSATEVIWPGLVRKIMDRLEVEVSRNVIEQLARRLVRNLRRQVKQHRSRLLATIAILPVLVAIALWQLQSDAVVIGGISLALAAALIKVVGEGLSRPLSQWVTTLFEERNYGKQIGYMAEIHDDLEYLERRLKKDGGRILITIDDLDRCEPEKSVEVLQAINLLLNFDSFIVCLGIDARVTTRAVEKHYQDLLKPTGASGYEYLDKVVQIPFRIPKPTEPEISSFMEKVMNGQRSPTDSRTEVAVTPHATGGPGASPLPEPATGTPNGAKGASAPRVDPSPRVDFTPTEQAAFRSLTPFLRRNPRHLKRLVNVYRLVRTLATLRGQNFVAQNPTLAVRWLVMCGQWPYTTFVMLRHLDSLRNDKDETDYSGAQQEAQKSNSDPLTYLFEKVTPSLSEKRQEALDDDVELLKRLMATEEGRPTWEQLITLRQYTINFNPAVEAEIVPSIEEENRLEENRTGALLSGRKASPSSTRVKPVPRRRAARTPPKD